MLKKLMLAKILQHQKLFFNKFLFSFDCYINLTMYESKNFLSVLLLLQMNIRFPAVRKKYRTMYYIILVNDRYQCSF